jgi:hypothetical protein
VKHVTPLLLTQLFALAALVFAVLAFSVRWRATMRRPSPLDRAPLKGQARSGVVYAFSLGMMPWAKESTRRHLVAYLRGIGFHVGIFSGLLALLVSPAWFRLPAPALAAACSSAGRCSGPLARDALVERNLRQLAPPTILSDPGDRFWRPRAALVTPLDARHVSGETPDLSLYAPLGKSHCIYFFVHPGRNVIHPLRRPPGRLPSQAVIS